MIARALDPNNWDLYLKGDRIAFIENNDEVAQHIRTRLLLFLEEWFLDVEAGTPWFQKIFIKPADLLEIEVIIKDRILQTDHVKELTSFDLSFDNRTLSIDFGCTTDFGSINNIEVALDV